ncbi:hypothetical protein KM043_008417 [Ampulex compressa]|nr:hypothetical protein KM043_008417 [Ampulex compressa]
MNEQTTGDSSKTLQWPDYLVIAVVLSISAIIGIYYRFTGGRQRTAEEYFSANRSMGVVPLAIALMVSFMSAIALLGISAENYAHGTQFTLWYLGGIFATPAAMYLYLPVFFELNTMSVYEYLERRFNVAIRLIAASANFLQLLLYTGIVLFAPSLALEATTGLSGTTSVLVIGVICTFYSTIGGIKAVLITDVFQGILMFAGVFCVLGIAASDLEGGLSNVWSIAYEGGRINFFDFRFDPTIRHTFWGLVIGGSFMFLSLFAVNQVQVQRLLTVKDLKASQHALALSGPIMLALGLLVSFSGLALYTVYKDCDPVSAGQIKRFDEIMAYFAATKMSRAPGLTGLFISAVFSASLSTISAILNSLAAAALEDYLRPLCRKMGVDFPEERAMLIGKGLAVFNGFACLAMAFLASTFDTLIEVTIMFSGAIGGPLLGVFTLGMFFESANEIGAMVGLVTSLITCMAIALGKRPRAVPLPMSVEGCDNSTLLSNYGNSTALWTEADAGQYSYLYRISYMWHNPMGCAITIMLGLLTSLIARKVLPRSRPQPDPELFVPFLASKIKRRRQDAEKTTSSQVFVLEPSYGK